MRASFFRRNLSIARQSVRIVLFGICDVELLFLPRWCFLSDRLSIVFLYRNEWVLFLVSRLLNFATFALLFYRTGIQWGNQTFITSTATFAIWGYSKLFFVFVDALRLRILTFILELSLWYFKLALLYHIIIFTKALARFLFDNFALFSWIRDWRLIDRTLFWDSSVAISTKFVLYIHSFWFSHLSWLGFYLIHFNLLILFILKLFSVVDSFIFRREWFRCLHFCLRFHEDASSWIN